MQYCDYVRNPAAMPKDLAKILGFNKVLSPDDEVEIISDPERPKSGNPRTILEGNPAYLMKHINEKCVIGIIIESMQADRNLIEHARQKEKLLIINAAKITNAEDAYRSRNIAYARELMKNALHYGIDIAMASTAKNEHEILSAQQLIEVAKMLGASGEQAKKMLSRLVGT